MNPLFVRVFPELSRFPTLEDAKKAYKRATWQLLLSRRWWLASMVLALLVILVNDLTLRLLSLYVNRNTILLGLPVVGGLAIPLGGVVIVWLLRRTIQRSLRQQLADRGIPCCVRCGYDLTGNTSGICPECGERK